MKGHTLLISACLIALYIGCQKEPLTSLVGTHWQFIHYVDADDQTLHAYPRELESYQLIFDTDTSLSLPNGCNYLEGTYGIREAGELFISSLWPGTSLGCGDFANWESRIVRVLQQSASYEASAQTLVISNAQGELYFKRIKK
ncbi:META domain-containing protein [Parapedobacter sp. 10938]|uniref:META domain-containing protein n=1 Tax=Parapedobacter flavus TaxID=3110225 RepID=UPI002DB8EC43|nr:META domain-containing protein [Parapedobacter sp. 10938]MEC3881489.1 META domain-containing protein [Parapedobacter sp. 10938]